MLKTILYIIHLDICSPVTTSNNYNLQPHIIFHFISSVSIEPVISYYSIHGGCRFLIWDFSVVVIDADRKFNGVFDESIGALNITVWTLAQKNHKEISA